jgi:hypothetical protein
MFAIGCLLLVILPIVGLVIGLFLAGTAGAIWGAAIGFGVAAIAAGISMAALVQARRRG